MKGRFFHYTFSKIKVFDIYSILKNHKVLKFTQRQILNTSSDHSSSINLNNTYIVFVSKHH